YVVSQAYHAAGVQNGAATASALVAPTGSAIGDGQPVDHDSEPLVDVKHPVLVVAADGQEAGARPLDVQALINRQLVAGQGDCLAVKTGGEDERVSILGFGDRVPQRPRPLVKVVQDGQRAGNRADFKGFEPR